MSNLHLVMVCLSAVLEVCNIWLLWRLMFSTGKTVSVGVGAWWGQNIRALFAQLPLSQYYRGLVNVPGQVSWWQGSSTYAAQGQIFLNTQSSLRTALQGGAFPREDHHQEISKGRVCGEHWSLLAHLTPEPPRGGLRDVGQQHSALPTPVSLREGRVSVRPGNNQSEQLTSTLSPSWSCFVMGSTFPGR